MIRTLVFVAALMSAGFAQAPPPNRAIGAVVQVDEKGGVLKTDSGETVPFVLQPDTRIQRVAPGEKDLTRAQTIPAAEIAPGDRVLVRGAAGGGGIVAQSVIVMSGSDIAQKQQKERMEWQRRGVGGLVVSTDPKAREIRIRIPSLTGGEPSLMTVALKEGAALRRYAPDSVKFSDARLSRIEEIKPGDQLRARGDKTEDGSRLSAEEVVTGEFRTVAATVKAVNAEGNQLEVSEMGSNKPLTVHVTPDSNLRKMFSFGGQGGPGGPGGQGGPRVAGAPGAGGPPGGTPGGMMGGGRRPDLSQMLERLPKIAVTDLKPGDTIVVASTVGANPAALTAITLLANADFLIAMQQRRQQASRGQGTGPGMGNWNLGDMSMIPMQ